jgi:hypothetical protein
MRANVQQLSLPLELTDDASHATVTDDGQECVLTDQERPLAIRTAGVAKSMLKTWQHWWRSSKCSHAIGSPEGLAQYFQHLQAIGKSHSSINMACYLIGRWLTQEGGLDPATERLLEQVMTSTSHAKNRNLGKGASSVLGCAEIDALIAAADPLSPQDTRDVSAMLVQFETMAASDQIFGHRHEGTWLFAPLLRSSVSFQDDGTAKIEIAAVNGHRPQAPAVLTARTAQWLRRMMDGRMDRHPELFRSENGPLTHAAWRHSILDIARRAGFPQPFRIRGLRRSRSHAMLIDGIDKKEVLRESSWQSAKSVNRAKRSLRYRNVPFLPGSIGMVHSKRPSTFMRGYNRPLFASSG